MVGSEMIATLASLSSTILHWLVRTVSRIPPPLWAKIVIIVMLIAVKQGILL